MSVAAANAALPWWQHPPTLVLLWTDLAVWALLAAVLVYVAWLLRHPARAANWARAFRNGPALASAIVLLGAAGITLLDSVHLRLQLPPSAPAVRAEPVEAPAAQAQAPQRTLPGPVYDTRTLSLLDLLLAELVEGREATYSVPLATHAFTMESQWVDGQLQRAAPRLQFGGAHLANPQADWAGDVARRALAGLLAGAGVAALLSLGLLALLARHAGLPLRATWARIRARRTRVPWQVAMATLWVLGAVAGPATALSGPYHLLGTDLTGNDVLYQSLKSVRTAFVIGALATLATLPLAVVLGLAAGYFRGWVDEAVQYLYTVLSSVPNVLLIAACVLMVQAFLDLHPELFETAAERADLKLFLLCMVLGLTGWAGLCRLLRAETLKLRELEYVQAAEAFAVPHGRILLRHVLPNVMHLVLIVTVLEFSALILYEAVLSYVGVGVDPSMNSFGGMINLARNEMSRDPLVWWSFSSAFGFMLVLVLAANLFADGVRDAFDPRRAGQRA